MRIRKEVGRWSWKTFLAVFGIVFISYAIFYTIIGWLDNFENFFRSTLFVYMGILPLTLAASFAHGSRTMTLYINDYESISDFKNILLKHIINKNLVLLNKTAARIVFKPTHWFYRLANSWGTTEYVTLHWGSEIIISGPTHRIQQVDDSLRWNKDFKN